MTVRIGDKEYPTRRPQDLDDQLLAATGCNAAEIARGLAGDPIAGTVAAALLPFLAEADRPGMVDLAGQIAVAGTQGVSAQVAVLYAAAGADDLDGRTIAQLREVAEREAVDLGSVKRLEDIRAAIRAARQERAAAAAEVGE